MGLIVQKYGGTSVRDAERVMNVARRITDAYKAGNGVVVAVSAQGDTTDDLIEKAKEINPDASKREMDMLLATGEQISISLLAMAIEKIGCPVVSLTGWQAGVKTDSKYGAARIKTIDTERIQNELDRKQIVIVAGFQGINKYDDITTLGRGGSDTSAVALAAALHADVCEIYTDVDGVFTADPRFVKNAYKLDDISYDEMLELASLGANVLHNRSVEMAKKYNVKLSVRSSLNNNDGTYVKEVEQVEKMLVRGVTRDNDVARIALCGVEDTPGKAFSVFRMLAKHGISVDLIIQSIGNGNKKDISFTTTEEDLQPVLDLLEENKDIIKADEVKWTKEVSKVSIVGAGMVNNSGVAATMFEALYDAHINISMIATSEIKISVLVDRKDAEAAVVAIHDKFMLK
ncbi:MAG: aspartate kinase [Clostridia bacterium]|jgi:aspartate kinase|nr:aspartate kinase [Clostridia bacterium]MCI8979452.1 aspartate kinase [Clostridia bacterium]MCI9086072.1 aspartate kinase [Clostridia bacterium]NDO19141.1 aspartate kinase [Lachnospiraceae bacterium MD329]